MELISPNPLYARDIITQQDRELFDVIQLISDELLLNKIPLKFGKILMQNKMYGRPHAFREMIHKTFINKRNISMRRIRKYRIIILLYMQFRSQVTIQDADLTLLLDDMFYCVVDVESLVKLELKYYLGKNEYYMNVAHP